MSVGDCVAKDGRVGFWVGDVGLASWRIGYTLGDC